MPDDPALVKQFLDLDYKTGKLAVNFHAGQERAWNSTKRFIVVLSGTQGGKTVQGPIWLHREIKRKGPGDYLVVSPSYALMSKKALPEFEKLFSGYFRLGKYHSQEKIFKVSPWGERQLFGAEQVVPTKVFFGHAADPESLESATAKAAWLDEAGQKRFKLDSWEAVQRRLSVHQGRCLITTTPYTLGWLKAVLYDPWKKSEGKHPDIDVVCFDSTENPAFPRAEFERARQTLPAWKFDLFYRAIFTRPAGMIYDCFDEDVHVVERFPVPDTWRRTCGLDFGGVHTAAVFGAEDPDTGVIYIHREYWPSGQCRAAREHCAALKQLEPNLPLAVGGSQSEIQWRQEFSMAGLPVIPSPAREVEVGIDRVYGAFLRKEVKIFKDLHHTLDDVLTYSRELDESGEPTDKIENKEQFHFCDSLRYLISWLRPAGRLNLTPQVVAGQGSPRALPAPEPQQDPTLDRPEDRQFIPDAEFEIVQPRKRMFGREVRTRPRFFRR